MQSDRNQTTLSAAEIRDFAKEELGGNQIKNDMDDGRKEWLRGYRYAFSYLIHWMDFPRDR
jgi:hypothetical protein